MADALAETGFDVILHGTNHAMDQGKKGITNCLSNWEKKYPDIKILGINKKSGCAGYHYRFRAEWNKNCGIKLYIWSEWHCTAFGYAVCSKSSGRRKVKADIASAKEQSDFVVVCPHWGTEYSLTTGQHGEKVDKNFCRKRC